MKHIISLLSIALLFNSSVLSQEIQDNTRYFKYLITFGNNHWSYIDTLEIISKTDDTTEFEIGDVQFIKRGNLIYKTSRNNSILLYDYTLEAGDTFTLKLDSLTKQFFLIDSTNSIVLEDGKSYKHWYLHSLLKDSNFDIVWVQNLGEKIMGWDWTIYGISHYPGIYGICTDNNLVYWGMRNPFTKTCNFDSLSRAVKIEENYIQYNLKFFPNPAQNILQWNSDEVFKFSVYSSDGKLYLEGNASGQIDLSPLTSGMYRIVLIGKNSIYQTLILKE